ncbi:MAG: AAA family ATPase [Anaerolineales bacterium]|nr:AAA family ATPase [Anaerolineales bacterium]
MQPTFVLFSGLPGTGKSTLADRLARELCWPLLRIDDVAACLPAEMDRDTLSFWDQAIAALLLLAEAQLKLGVNLIADSIFMNYDRFHAQAIARESGACFLPVHTFVSDESVWEQRVNERRAACASAGGIASWDQVRLQRKGYRPWGAGTALFIDNVRPLDENYAAVLAFVTSPAPSLVPLAEVAYTPGKYHRENHDQST